ncbi:MAG: DNA polymerase III subunit gamma/tau [Vampirovibrionales bacterium]|nr:DNA polymerase III subunit gamma/tau [Vampirovibrionales bacterium]
MPAIQTYVPLYRKYRPQSFADLVGQEAIVQTLTNAIETQKVAHAYLLCGPRGTGKTSTARILAKSLNCAQGPTATPCQTCDACVGVTNGAAIDIIEIDAASNNGVENARDLIENCQFAPMSGRYKIYIVDEVHMLSTAAFNALLKTLEEPPPNVVFIFATTEAHKVLPTIISRCQRFDFSRITTDQLIAHLTQTAEREGIRIAPEALQAIARHARGGMRNALSMLDQVGVLSQANPQTVVSQADVIRFIGALEQDALFELTDAIARQDAAALLAKLGNLNDRGVDPALLARDLAQHLRDLFLTAVCGPSVQAQELGVSVDALARLQTQSPSFSREEYPQLLQSLAALERDLRRTQQPQLWLEIGLMDLAFRTDVHTLKGLSERVASLEDALAGEAARTLLSAAPNSGGLPPTAPATSATAPLTPQRSTTPASQPATGFSSPAAASATPASVQPSISGGGLDWDAMIASIPSMPLRAQLTQQAFLLGIEGTRVTIGCPSEPVLQMLKKEDRFFHLQKAVDAAMGRTTQVVIVLEKTRPARGASVPPGPARAVAAVSAAPPAMESARPLHQVPTDSEPAPPLPPAPPDDDEPEAMETSVEAPPPAPQPHYADDEDDMAEAKKYTMELLQGKPLS